MQIVYSSDDDQFDFNSSIACVAMVGELERAGYHVTLKVEDGKHICVFCTTNLAQDNKPLCKQCEETRK